MGHYVYKYVFNSEIIYIGKCDFDLDQRLAQHGKPGDNIDKKYWDDINASDIYYCTLANATMSDVVESELINSHKPKCNTAKMSDWDGLKLPEPNWKKYYKPEKVPFVKKEKDLTKISDKKLKALIWEAFQCKIAVDYLYPVVKSKTITRKELKHPFLNKTEERPCIILHNSDFHGFIAEIKIKDPDRYCRDIIKPLWQYCVHGLSLIHFHTKKVSGGMSIIGVYEFNENEVILFLDSNVCKNWHELLDLVISSRVKEFHHNLEVINANHKRLVSLYNSDDDCSLKYVLLGYILSGIHINKSITDEEIVNILEALKTF